jgi:hypothetical protein
MEKLTHAPGAKMAYCALNEHQETKTPKKSENQKELRKKGTSSSRAPVAHSSGPPASVGLATTSQLSLADLDRLLTESPCSFEIENSAFFLLPTVTGLPNFPTNRPDSTSKTSRHTDSSHNKTRRCSTTTFQALIGLDLRGAHNQSQGHERHRSHNACMYSFSHFLSSLLFFSVTGFFSLLSSL